MKKTIAILAILALVALTAPVLAGEGHKCTAGTQECLDKMAAKLASKGWIGIELDKTKKGELVITKVIENSPAEEAGLKKGDVLLAMNGLSLTDESEETKKKLEKTWMSFKPGNEVVYKIDRNGKYTKANITLGHMPKDLVASYVGRHMLEHATTAVAKK
jgi:S1-C subfamily serine protease